MTEEIREREKTSAEDLDEREVPIFSGMENEPPEQTVKELQQMLENQKIGFMKFVFKIIGDTREREKLLREMNEKIEWLKASVMITDEQEECCMKEGDLLCDTGETSAAEWARREAAERGKEPLEQKVKLLQQKLDKEEIAFEEFRVKMTEEIRECDDLLRKVDQSIKELEASVMITDEQEECCMKKSELLCDAGKTSAGAEEWTRRVAAEKVLEGLEQKYTEFWQKLEDQERVHEGLIAIMTQEIIEREKSSAGAEEWTRRVAAEKVMECLEQKYTEFWQKLEDQERVHEGLIAIMTQEIIEREKSSAAEWARREAAERGKEPLEENIKELQQMLEDQERVSEGFRAQVPEEMKEREKTSAEDLDKKEVEREMELLKQKIKELQQMLEDQESVSEGFRPQIPEEMKEREKTSAEEPNKREEAEREEESLEQNVKGLQQKLEDRQTDVNGLKAQVTEGISKREKTSADLPGTAEWDLSEAAEGEKVDLEQKVRELQQMLEDQERAFEFYRVIITEEIQGIDDLLRKISESTELLEATINNENDRIMSKMLKMTARPR
uniref:Golgin subfamily A member 6-like protein 1 isoform X18 n=1 Tax=Camelus bactrianus TaxID=9837 RepID=A0A9W3FTE0_CAMBA|nr:golgin subfamily A member 6-like protein 1 isoform X18 [Camelus bactrianus]